MINNITTSVLLIISVLIFYFFVWQCRWKKFDPEWLIDLAKQQYPDEPWLQKALSNCTKISGNYFVNPRNPNQPGSQWQFDKTIRLEDPEKGQILLDILEGGRVGSIEYIGLMTKKGI